MYCWKCSQLSEQVDKLLFRVVCDHCGSWLHCCKGCQNYCPGKPNDCLMPGIDVIVDREAGNFCEEFQIPVKIIKTNQTSIDDVAKNLFGKDAADEIRKKSDNDDFDSLFK